MRLLRGWLVLLAAMLVSGCLPSIWSDELLGVDVALDPKEWNGPWLESGGNVVRMELLDAKTGVIGGGRYSCERVTPNGAVEAVQLRLARTEQCKGLCPTWYVPVHGKFGPELGFQARLQYKPSIVPGVAYEYSTVYARSGSSLAIYFFAEMEPIKAMIDSGSIPGEIIGDEVFVGKLIPRHFDLLFSKQHPLVAWQSPIVAIKLPTALDPCKAETPPK